MIIMIIKMVMVVVVMMTMMMANAMGTLLFLGLMKRWKDIWRLMLDRSKKAV